MNDHPNFFTLETERLLIRPLTLDDLDAVCLISDESFGEAPRAARKEWLQWSVMNTVALARLWQPPYGERAITIQATGQMIGMVGIVPCYGPFDKLPYFRERCTEPVTKLSRPEMGLYWSLARAHRGYGYATEAAQALTQHLFRHLGLKRCVATTEYDNAASQAVMERLGMRIERNPDPQPEWFQIVGILENPALLKP